MNAIVKADELLRNWSQLLQDEPRLRARNAASRLGVSEGQLTAARCGDNVIRLRQDYKELLTRLVEVGQVMTITRNENAVHEKVGYYSNLQLKDHGGGAFDHNINLRIFFNNWGEVFAVSENGRNSLQVFDRDGTSTHKIYQTDNGDAAAWDKLVEDFRADDQSQNFSTQEPYSPYTPEPAEQVDRDALLKQWNDITDLHQFWFMLREHKLSRLDALKLATPDLARQVATDAWRGVLQQAADSGLQIMVFVRSPGVAQIHTGTIHKLVETDEWFNILDPAFNLHLRTAAVKETWVAYRPTNTGGQTSLELYGEDGELICHFFGAVNTQAPELRGWRSLLEQLPTINT